MKLFWYNVNTFQTYDICSQQGRIQHLENVGTTFRKYTINKEKLSCETPSSAFWQQKRDISYHHLWTIYTKLYYNFFHFFRKGGIMGPSNHRYLFMWSDITLYVQDLLIWLKTRAKAHMREQALQ